MSLEYRHESRKVKLVKITRVALTALLTRRCRSQIVVDGLPSGAKLVGISEDVRFDFDEIVLKFEWEYWPEVPEDCALEYIPITIREVDLYDLIGKAMAGEK